MNSLKDIKKQLEKEINEGKAQKPQKNPIKVDDIPQSLLNHFSMFALIILVMLILSGVFVIVGIGRNIYFVIFALTLIIALSVYTGYGFNKLLQYGFKTYAGTCMQVNYQKNLIGSSSNKNKTVSYIIKCDDKIIELPATKSTSEIPVGAKIRIFAPINVVEYSVNSAIRLSSYYNWEYATEKKGQTN